MRDLKVSVEAVIEMIKECEQNLFTEGQLHAYEAVLRMIEKTEGE